jgi:pantoate--beta-alanine ligase
VAEVKKQVVDAINAYPEMEVEYYEIVNGDDMQPISDWSESTNPVGCVTVYLGDVRLIDNIKYKKQ